VQLAHNFGAPSLQGDGVVLYHFGLPPFSCQDVHGLYIRLDEQISTLRVLSRHYGGFCTKNGFGYDDDDDTTPYGYDEVQDVFFFFGNF
jgi:hypothetical protein